MVTNDECGVRLPGTPMKAGPRDRRGRLTVRLLAGLRTALARRRVRARLREDLRHLDNHLLHDIGVRREELVRQAYRPFWRE